MTWWLRAHQAHLPITAVVGVCIVAWLAAGGAALDGAIASPVKVGVAVPMVLWAPIAVVAAVCGALSVDDGRPDRSVTVRSNDALTAGFVVTILAVLLLGLLPAVVLVGSDPASVGRNAVGLVGLALLLRRRFGGGAATAIVAGYFVACALLGAEPDGGAAWWAWPVADLGPVDTIIAIVLIAAGLANGATAGTRSLTTR